MTSPEPGTHTRHRVDEMDGSAPTARADELVRRDDSEQGGRTAGAGVPAAEAIDLRKVYGSGQTQDRVRGCIRAVSSRLLRTVAVVSGLLLP